MTSIRANFFAYFSYGQVDIKLLSQYRRCQRELKL